MIPVIWPPSTSSTCSDHGGVAALRVRLVLRERRSTVGRGRNQPRALAGSSLPEAPLRDVLVGLQPQLVRRHRPGRVLGEQRGERRHVVALERVDVAGQQLALLLVQRLRRLALAGDVGVRQRRAGPLQRAVDRRDGGVEQLGHLGGRPLQHLAQDQDGALLRRQVLQGGDEREPDRLAQLGDLGRVAGGRHDPGVGDRLQPRDLGQRRAEGGVGRLAPDPCPSAGHASAGRPASRSRRWWRSGRARSAARTRPSNRSRAFQARTMVSCTASSASNAEPSIR